MNTRTTGGVLLAVGVILALVGLFADTLGLGTEGGTGYKQITATIVGVVVGGIGAGLLRRKPS